MESLLLTREELRTIRQDLGLSRREAAELLGKSASSLNSYERGDRDLNEDPAFILLTRLLAAKPALIQPLRDIAEKRPDWDPGMRVTALAASSPEAAEMVGEFIFLLLGSKKSVDG